LVEVKLKENLEVLWRRKVNNGLRKFAHDEQCSFRAMATNTMRWARRINEQL
jgi:hypothetical protein